MPSSETLRIGIVDDTPEDRELYRRLLRADADRAYRFIEADTGAAGLELCGDEVDCLLLDYRLPDVDGLEFLAELRERRLTCPVIILTGQGSEAVAVQAMKSGAQDYLLKNEVTQDRLIRAVANAIEKVALIRKVENRTEELARANAELEKEVTQRRTAEAALQRMYEDLERLVQVRTEALSRANQDLNREVAERRRAEQERARLLEREQEASRLKDEFLATVSHELRTPLNAVLGWARVLREMNVSSSTRTRALESIERNATLQARLIEDLLEISRIVTGKFRLDVEPLDLVAIVDGAVEGIRPAAEAKRIRLDVRHPDRPALITGDSDRLQQVVWNLLQNAVKFTPERGEVRVAVRHDDGCELAVSDTGPGISPAFLPHIFEPFRQADGSTTRAHGGLGIGLAIVRQIVELHGGSVRALSQGEGRGATFVVRLPARATSDDEILRPENPESTLRASFDGAPALDGLRVLIVDDEADARELIATSLKHYGADVVAATSADEALQLIESRVPDVLLSDIGMEGEDGYMLLRRVRKLPRDRGGMVPAVALTAYAGPGDRARASAAGFQFHIAKPFDPLDLARVLQTFSPAARSRR